MSTLVITVGMPASGKSTWADWQGYEVVSSDAIREELCGDPTDQGRNNEVFALFHERIKDALWRGQTIVADSTGLDKFARERLRNIAEEEDAFIALACWNNPEDARERNQTRERVVPEHVMDRMAEKLEKFYDDLQDEYHLYDFVFTVEVD